MRAWWEQFTWRSLSSEHMPGVQEWRATVQDTTPHTKNCNGTNWIVFWGLLKPGTAEGAKRVSCQLSSEPRKLLPVSCLVKENSWVVAMRLLWLTSSVCCPSLPDLFLIFKQQNKGCSIWGRSRGQQVYERGRSQINKGGWDGEGEVRLSFTSSHPC